MAVNSRTRDEHLFDDGPKRLLALDGGGIRGALTLGYLGRIEAILRERTGGDPAFRLCDYFDLIGGTSTGAIIATGLALGLSVDELDGIYRTLGEKIFADSVFRIGLIGAKFPKEPLIEALDSYFGDETLGSDKLRTGLMVVTKRLDTGSPWLLHNNPRGAFYDSVGDGVANKDLLLTSIVRASTAAPHYFDPELIEIAPETFGAFVDGGVSPYNNPAMQVLMLATCSGYGLNWHFGADRLLLVSVGTGYREISVPAHEVMTMPAVRLAAESVLSIMQDANWQGQALLQWMGRSPTAWTIDSEIGDLRADSLGNGPDLLSYLRYEVALQPDWLRDTLGVELSARQCEALYSMDEPANVAELTRLGRSAAQIQVRPDHFPLAFDL
ncbi:patatin-like phospholipase family protein [Mycobacterium sp. CVI_P3]|uniref:Patatin-like phospholipase family protein n=1 Tax=Mycobacterium pinniadriaticum TaxID=2994102 RepID=A0ABT3SKU3_9MYCO|nr:patatin-like phospholipase family protein [Mycobacterium pinniadriaticum]MCX2933721.1 patatin-like phospholipase family protein [Mycobacterium pinniadriaticum]MCX2940143.1 patatin-like phospholipase family protein [Mycobacterium pinniadriaticum]